MKAILIDPFSKSIKEVDYNGDLNHLYSFLDCSMVEAPIHYSNGDSLYIDEEGWINVDNKLLAGFMFPNWNYPIIGKGLIVGIDDEGVDAACKSSIEDFKAIIWKNNEEMRVFGTRVNLI